jgi:hypothetical protein
MMPWFLCLLWTHAQGRQDLHRERDVVAVGNGGAPLPFGSNDLPVSPFGASPQRA